MYKFQGCTPRSANVERVFDSMVAIGPRDKRIGWALRDAPDSARPKWLR